jgi:predicted amidohydrolase YtcJ
VVWHPEERVTREQALKMFTWYPAFATFSEDRHGSIVVGKAADFSVFDRDIMKVPATEILSTRVLSTYVGGKIVYELKSP